MNEGAKYNDDGMAIPYDPTEVPESEVKTTSMNSSEMATAYDPTERHGYEGEVELINETISLSGISRTINRHNIDTNNYPVRKAIGEKLKALGHFEAGERHLVSAEKLRLEQKSERAIANAERAQQEFADLYKE